MQSSNRFPDGPVSSAQSPPKRRLSSASAVQSHSVPLPPPVNLSHKRPRLSDANNMSRVVSRTHGVIPVGMKPHAGTKKLLIKNLRTSNPNRDHALHEYYERLWNDIDVFLTSVFAGDDGHQCYDKLYRGIEDLCRSGKADDVYKRLRARMESHLQNNILVMVTSAVATKPVDVLRLIHSHWKMWNRHMALIRNVFSYLDRSYLLNMRDLRQINELAIFLFHKMIFGEKPSLNRLNKEGRDLIDGMCLLLQHERDKLWDPEQARWADEKLLKESVSMIHVVGLYSKIFEPTFLEKSHGYFQKAAEEKEHGRIDRYVQDCKKMRLLEEDICMKFNLDSSTKKALVDDVNQIFIVDRKDKLLDVGDIGALLEDKDVLVMKALFELLKTTGLHKELKYPWEHYIKDHGSRIVNNIARVDHMVVDLLLLRRDLDVMVRDAFDRDEDFTYGLRDAFGSFVNDKKMLTTWGTGTSKVGEMIAKYIDALLRGGMKSLPPELLADVTDRRDAEKAGKSAGDSLDAELDQQLDNALELFRHIQGKDVFEAFYKKDLARRLLMNRSASQDAERNMLTKLKSECGSIFTHNLEQMFKDQELAREEMAAFKAWREGKEGKTGMDLYVNILSHAAWPTYPEVPCKLPPDVQKHILNFDQYYNRKHTGRRLTWKHNLAQCVVTARFPRGTKELMVSGFQAIVLLLFNNCIGDEMLDYGFIQKESGLPAPELNRILQSLACGKVRVLTKSPKSRDVNPSDRFGINDKFSDPKIRVKINTIQMKETPQENKETHERVAADRMFETQAAIVRIMKSRKTVGHAELIAEVITATKKRGVIDVGVIKQNIEKLIDKDYMERNTETQMYEYIA